MKIFEDIYGLTEEKDVKDQFTKLENLQSIIDSTQIKSAHEEVKKLTKIITALKEIEGFEKFSMGAVLRKLGPEKSTKSVQGTKIMEFFRDKHNLTEEKDVRQKLEKLKDFESCRFKVVLGQLQDKNLLIDDIKEVSKTNHTQERYLGMTFPN